MRRRQLTHEAVAILGSMETDGRLAKITAGQLSRSLYLEVDECLMALGGKWDRRLGGHVFDDDPRDALDRVVLTGGAFSHKKQDFGFFETPAPIAEQLVRVAGVEASHRVLEPSAGRGALLGALATHIPIWKIDLTAIELMPENVQALTANGWSEHTIEADFLLYVERPFDRIIMNPPFARQADVDHVRHAYELLAFGGRLVSVMAAIKFRRNRKTDALRALIETNGSIRNLPDDAFHDSGTAVRTVLVTLDKPCKCDVHGELGAECRPVSITDVFTRVREVEVPSYCPGRAANGARPAEPCGADLREPGALQVWEWNDAVWPARLGTPDDETSDEVEQGGVLLDAIAGGDRGEGWIEHVAYYCRRCGACIVEGERREIDDEPVRPAVEEHGHGGD